MRRREFLALGATAPWAFAQKRNSDVATASATQDTTPRVGIVLSSFSGGQDHDGTKLAGLADPRPPGADLTSAQLDAMVRKAIELAASRAGDFATLVGSEDWVVIQPHSRPSSLRGSLADPRIVRSVISYLAERQRGLRFTLAIGAAQEWAVEVEGLSYRRVIAECSGRFPGLRFELADLTSIEAVELPVPGKTLARHHPTGVYSIPKIVQQCDRLITIAPLATDSVTGVSLSVQNYMDMVAASKYGDLLKLGTADEVMIDLFSYHPADFAVLGGCWGVEGDWPDGSGAASIHHNLVIAGAKAVSVDAVGAAVMGFDPAALPFLSLGAKKGFGAYDLGLIWTRGNQIEEARKAFRKPSRWRR